MKYLLTVLALVFFQFSGLGQKHNDNKEIEVESRVEALRQAMVDADGAN